MDNIIHYVIAYYKSVNKVDTIYTKFNNIKDSYIKCDPLIGMLYYSLLLYRIEHLNDNTRDSESESESSSASSGNSDSNASSTEFDRNNIWCIDHNSLYIDTCTECCEIKKSINHINILYQIIQQQQIINKDKYLNTLIRYLKIYLMMHKTCIIDKKWDDLNDIDLLHGLIKIIYDELRKKYKHTDILLRFVSLNKSYNEY